MDLDRLGTLRTRLGRAARAVSACGSGHGGLRAGRKGSRPRSAVVLRRQGCGTGTGTGEFGVSIARKGATRNEISGRRRMTNKRKSLRNKIRVSKFGFFSICLMALLFRGAFTLVAQDKSITFDELVQSAEQWARE